ncbi:MAG: hypothetical protein DYG89_44565 [Caldilinea sp. CFX5]|nr:hypothetical protein [Caldilinea sp. CFX5]
MGFQLIRGDPRTWRADLSTLWQLLRPAGASGALLLALLVVRGSLGTPIAYTPPADVQGYSYSVAQGNPATTVGLHPADILGAGSVLLIPCANLGLLCEDTTTGAVDDITALSYGNDFAPDGLPNANFSVSGGSQGVSGSAVRAEATCAPAQAQADVFAAQLDGSNNQDLDGDGAACAGNSGFALGLSEAATGDNLDALARDPCTVVDLNCDGLPEAPIYLTLAAASPSLALIGAGAADILSASPDYGLLLWATASELGLGSGDRIDGLCLNENGNGRFDSGDQLLFSLATGSPTLTTLGASAADLVQAGPKVVTPAALLGLAAGDELDAALCTAAYAAFTTSAPTKLYLPYIERR